MNEIPRNNRHLLFDILLSIICIILICIMFRGISNDMKLLKCMVIPIYIILLLFSMFATSTCIKFNSIKKEQWTHKKVLVLFSFVLDMLIVLEVCIFTIITPVFNEMIVFTAMFVVIGVLLHLTINTAQEVFSKN